MRIEFTMSRKDDPYLGIVKEERGLLERILTIFPGYRGYREKEVLRETDKLIRDTLFNDLIDVKERLRGIYRSLVSSGSADAKEAEKLMMRLDSMAERIRHATYGYSPLMNVIKVDERHILSLMSFDAGLADCIVKVKNAVLSEKNVSKPLSDIDISLRELEETFNRRREFMMGLRR
jgi:hypothetical protein